MAEALIGGCDSLLWRAEEPCAAYCAPQKKRLILFGSSARIRKWLGDRDSTPDKRSQSSMVDCLFPKYWIYFAINLNR